jgi:hypothetical protein
MALKTDFSLPEAKYSAKLADRQASAGALPGLEALQRSSCWLTPGNRFSPTDPREEAISQLMPSGLAQLVAEDVDGLQEQRPLGSVAAERPVTAIDAGVVKLGHTPDGVVGAVRAAAVTHHPDGRVVLRTYRPGIFSFSSQNRLAVFHDMGKALGRADFYVELDDGGLPQKEKVELGPHDHRLLDRARNFVERLVQRRMCQGLEDGLVVFDGALTLRTFDTPQVFLREVHEACQDRRLSIVAVSKQTGLTVRGVDIRLLLNGEPALPARRKLTTEIRAESRSGAHRALGDLYIVRFAPGGDTYRVDVDPEPGLMSSVVLDEFASACLHRNGYPEPLIEAHAFSYMPPAVVMQLQAHADDTYGLDVRPEINLGPVFAPFGGRYK